MYRDEEPEEVHEMVSESGGSAGLASEAYGHRLEGVIYVGMFDLNICYFVYVQGQGSLYTKEFVEQVLELMISNILEENKTGVYMRVAHSMSQAENLVLDEKKKIADNRNKMARSYRAAVTKHESAKRRREEERKKSLMMHRIPGEPAKPVQRSFVEYHPRNLLLELNEINKKMRQHFRVDDYYSVPMILNMALPHIANIWSMNIERLVKDYEESLIISTPGFMTGTGRPSRKLSAPKREEILKKKEEDIQEKRNEYLAMYGAMQEMKEQYVYIA